MITLQHHQSHVKWNCFPAAVKVLLSHFGDDHSEDDVAVLLGTDPDVGTNRWNVKRLSEWGYTVKCGMASTSYLRAAMAAGDPVLLTVVLPKFDFRTHTVVLVGLDRTHAHIYDPALPSGPTPIKRSDLLGCWELQGCFCAVVHHPDFAKFIYNADGNPQEVYSLSPERATGFGRVEKVTGILLTGDTIAAAQAESNTLAGLYRAWKNIRFSHIRVPAFNNRFLEPATLDYFGVTLVAADTYRGYVWSAKEWLCTEANYSIDVDKGIILVEYTGESSTWGPDGVAGDYPHGDPPGPPDNPPEYWPTAPTDPPPWWPSETYAIGCAANAGQQWATTDDVSVNPPTWTDRSVGLPQDVWGRHVDASVYRDTAAGTCLIGLLSDRWANARIYRSLDNFTTWAAVDLPNPCNFAGDAPPFDVSEVRTWSVAVDPNDPDRAYVLAWARRWVAGAWTYRMWVYRTEEARASAPSWESWQLRTTNSVWNVSSDDSNNGQSRLLDVGPDGTVWAVTFDLYTVPEGAPRVHRGTNHGESFVELNPNTAVAEGAGIVTYPVGVVASQLDPRVVVVYGEWNDGAATQQRCSVTTSRGNTWQQRDTGLPAGGINNNELYGLLFDPANNLRMVACVTTCNDLYQTLDLGENWTLLDAAYPTPFVRDGVHFYKDGLSHMVWGQGAGGTNRITYSGDGGTSSADRSGALPADFVSGVVKL